MHNKMPPEDSLLEKIIWRVLIGGICCVLIVLLCGSREVRRTIKNNRLPMRNIKLCGVNTDCCVLATIYGLNKKLKKSKMQVIAKACNSNYNHSHGLKRMEEIGVSVKR